MTRLLLLLLLALPLVGRAATISSTSCTSGNTTGCILLPLNLYPNTNSVSVQVTGTWSGQLVFEGSNDGTTYVEIRAYPVGGGSYSPSISTNGIWSVSTAGLFYFRVRAATWTSGTATVTLQPSTTEQPTDIVRMVGADFGPATVGLSQAATSAIVVPACALSTAPPIVTLTTTVQTVPATSLAARTQLVVRNLSSNQNVWCCVGSGCTPTASSAYVVLPNGDHLSLPVRPANTVRCRAAVGNADVNLLESSCGG